jgi:hypothetical protein
MTQLQLYDLPTRILAALSERRHRIRDGSQNDPWVPYQHEGVLYEINALTLDIREISLPLKQSS